MGYTLHVLDDKDFDALRIKNPKYHTEDALGFADVKAKTAYVRRTGINTLDQFVTAHELEELVSKYSDHEIEGIRYKKGGAARSIVPIVLGALAAPFTGGASLIPAVLGAASSIGMNQYAQSKHPEQLGKPGNIGSILMQGATGALSGAGGGAITSGAIKGATNAAPGFLSKAAGATKGALGFTGVDTTNAMIPPSAGGAPGVGTVISKVPGAAANATLPSGANALNAAQSAGTLASAAANPVLNSIQSSIPASAGLGFTPPAAGLSITPNAAAPSTMPNLIGMGGGTQASTQGAQSLTSTNPVYGGGSASSNLGFQGAGQTAGNTAKKSILDKVWEKFNTPLGMQAVGASVPLIGSAFAPKVEPFNPQESQMYQDLSQRIMTGAPKLTMTPEQKQAITANYDSQLEDARQQIVNRWKQARPGSDITSDTQLQQAMRELENEYAIQKANAITSAELGLTQQQTEMMSELASMDIYTLQQKAGIQAQEAKDFKEMLQNMGFMIASPTIYNR